MEYTIDRTSYRRSNRVDYTERVKPKNNYKIKTVFLNEIIISMSILIGVLGIKLLDLKYAEEWISKKINTGISYEELSSKVSSKYTSIYNDFKSVVSYEETESENKENDINDSLIKNEVATDSIFEEKAIEELATEEVNMTKSDADVVKQNYSIIKPVDGVITSAFGTRVDSNPIVSSYHTGLDIAANKGTNISASHDGEVTFAGTNGGYGECIMIKDGDLVTLYGHCSKINVKVGDKVKQGEKIGEVGMTGNATGPHVHFEIRYQDRFVNPEDVI